MNKQRRKRLNKVIMNIDSLHKIESKEDVLRILEESYQTVDECVDDEQMALDNIAETFAASSRSDNMEENISDMEDAKYSIEELQSLWRSDAGFDYRKEAAPLVTETIHKIASAVNRR